MSSFLEVEVFRAGDYGPKGVYGIEELEAMCADYAPSFHEAPVTADHAQSGPAYGWVHSLSRRGEVLVATLKDLSEEFVALIRKGAFRKRSVEIYRRFRATGRPYLRAVSFLGACPPEVKGLCDPLFNEKGLEDDGHDSYEFKESDTSILRDGSDVCDLSERSERSDLSESIAVLSERKASLEADIAETGARLRREGIERFCRGAAERGRVVPAWERAGLVEFMMTLDDSARVGRTERTSLGWFQAFLESLPVLAPLTEVAFESDREKRSTASPWPVPGSAAPVSAASMNLHERAVAFRELNPDLGYAEALLEAARRL